MRMTINPAECDGFGYCAEILPELVELDEWGFPVLGNGEVPAGLLGVATRAVHFCPRRALALEESVPRGG
jgi:ferredoxin